MVTWEKDWERERERARDRGRETDIVYCLAHRALRQGGNNIQSDHKSAYQTIQNKEFSICILISLIHSIIHPSIYPFTHPFILYHIPYIFNIVNREVTCSLKLQAKRDLQR